MSQPRVGIIGAGRRRQGLGPFVVRFLREAGAGIPCVLGTRAESVAETRRLLATRLGVEARGYTDFDAMLREEALDALAILSPSETHGQYLERALKTGLHVLCEKPLVWGEPELTSRSSELVARFADAGLLLWENCQWPFTLTAFSELHPSALGEPLRSFAMRLSPVSSGVRMLGDALPHPLSLLQALVPPAAASLEGIRFRAGPRPGDMVVAFRYIASPTVVEVEIELARSDVSPREAAYGVNDHWAHRRIRSADYAISFVCGERAVAVPDPLEQLVGAFVEELRSVASGMRRAPRRTDVAARMAMLECVVEAYRAEAAA